MNMSDEHKAVWETALKRFDECWTSSKDEREQAKGDRRFYSIAGAQWEGAYGKQFEDRVKMEINLIHLAVIRIINEYRNNRISAKFISKDGDASDDLADFCADIYRADQQDSGAQEAFDNAFEEAVGGGFGAWRLINEYEDEYDPDNDQQRIRFEPITDADSCVFFDPHAKRQDKSDARFAFVITCMDPEAYKEEYDDDPSSWQKPMGEYEYDWWGVDRVYVAEYFVVEEASVERRTYQTIDGQTENHFAHEITEEDERRFEDVGTELVSRRKIKTRKVRKYILSGAGILEDVGHIAGKHIPVVPTYGKRWFVDGIERFCGHVRMAKDPLRLYNMQVSVLAEKAATAGDRTPIVSPEQMAGQEASWQDRAVKNLAYLMLNPVTGPNGEQIHQGPLGYTESAEVPQAMAALMEISRRDVGDLLGNQEGGEQIESNISGRAIELIQSRLDMQTYIYVSNMAKAHERSAEIWLSMIGDVYDEDDRTMKRVDDQEQVSFAKLGDRTLQDGKPAKAYDLKKAKMGVSIDVGPSSDTKRQAMVRSLTEVLGVIADPNDQTVISSMIMRNIDGEGIGAMREYFRKKLVQMGVEEPTDEDIAEAERAAQQQQDAPPTPQDQFLASEAQKNQAQARKLEAEVAETDADTDLKRAKTVEALAGISRDDRREVVDLSEAIAAATAAPVAR